MSKQLHRAGGWLLGLENEAACSSSRPPYNCSRHAVAQGLPAHPHTLGTNICLDIWSNMARKHSLAPCQRTASRLADSGSSARITRPMPNSKLPAGVAPGPGLVFPGGQRWSKGAHRATCSGWRPGKVGAPWSTLHAARALLSSPLEQYSVPMARLVSDRCCSSGCPAACSTRQRLQIANTLSSLCAMQEGQAS